MNIADTVLAVFRKRKIKKFLSDVPTGIRPLRDISTVNVIIDVEEPGFDKLREDILSWGRQNGLKVNIYFFDFRRLGKEELLLTSINTTILRKELDWIGTPEFSKVGALMYEPSDLLISMIDNGDFPIEFLSKCSKARFKIGRCPFEGHAYDMVIVGNPTEDLISDARRIFASMTDFVKRIM
ncbi:MAG: hypothetical protein IJ271_06450 [Bacteroidales bacterium]|nr:hypothetical protein [Bacteroidales bacterium]MBQ8049279.1 hypothetical protein [Bacteroidales bacterium]